MFSHLGPICVSAEAAFVRDSCTIVLVYCVLLYCTSVPREINTHRTHAAFEARNIRHCTIGGDPTQPIRDAVIVVAHFV